METFVLNLNMNPLILCIYRIKIVVVFINILQVETWQACVNCIAKDTIIKSSFVIFRSIYLIKWHCTGTICKGHMILEMNLNEPTKHFLVNTCLPKFR